MDPLDQMIELDHYGSNDLDEDENPEQIAEDDDDGDAEEGQGEDEKESPTKVVKKPRKPSNRPKLDVERLKGPKGLMCMERMFANVEFEGPGQEKQALDAVMGTLQFWGHRLFPKFSFDDLLEHMERLGTKKSLITLKKKIIFDLIEEDQPAASLSDGEAPAEQAEPVDAFSMLLEQETVPAAPPAAEPQLSAVQREMIERNRLVAAERRRARLEARQLVDDVAASSRNAELPASSSEGTEESPASSSRRTEEPPASSKEETQESPANSSKKTEEPPVSSSEGIEESPASSSEGTEQQPNVSESGPADPSPARAQERNRMEE